MDEAARASQIRSRPYQVIKGLAWCWLRKRAAPYKEQGRKWGQSELAWVLWTPQKGTTVPKRCPMAEGMSTREDPDNHGILNAIDHRQNRSMNRYFYQLTIIACPMLVQCSGLESVQSLQEKMFSSKASDSDQIEISYYSDYFSFVGSDSQGQVAFALDNNRGQDGKEFQAEHFAVLHDEHKGWVEVKGSGSYENVRHELRTIPNSETFQFQGNVEKGIHIESPNNQLTLSVEPIAFHIENKKGMAHLRMGSAAAVLQWGERQIPGRVIYEYLFLPQFNRLSRSYFGLWKDVHGLYLRVGGKGDFYFHSQNSELLQPLTGQVSGFLFLEKDSPTSLSKVSIVASDSELAFGFYQWPLSWKGTFYRGQTPYKVEVELNERKTLANWVIGGFSMGLVRGKISTEDNIYKVYGLGELLI
jgi:hypothetical protein